MTAPLVSIITPTYNHEAYIGKCIESVIDQSYPEWEMLILDDGSTDGTWEVILGYARREPRIKPVREDNRGILRLSESYNLCLEGSRGHLVAILEGDDFWSRHKLEVQVRSHLENPGLHMSYGRAKLFEKDGSIVSYPPPELQGVRPSIDYLRLLLLGRACIVPATVMIRKDVLRSMGGFTQFPGFPAVDLPTFLEVLSNKGSAAWIPEDLGFWRQHESQVTRTNSLKLLWGAHDVAASFLSGINNELRSELDVSERDVTKLTLEALPDHLLAALRHSLIERNVPEAERTACQLLLLGGRVRKAQAMAALLHMSLGMDMEWIFRLVDAVLRRAR